MSFDDALRVTDEGVVIRLWVVPGATRTKIDGYDCWKKAIRFKTSEPADKDKANRSILDFFKTLIGKETALVSGARSKDKQVLVLGAAQKDVVDALESA